MSDLEDEDYEDYEEESDYGEKEDYEEGTEEEEEGGVHRDRWNDKDDEEDSDEDDEDRQEVVEAVCGLDPEVVDPFLFLNVNQVEMEWRLDLICEFVLL